MKRFITRAVYTMAEDICVYAKNEQEAYKIIEEHGFYDHDTDGVECLDFKEVPESEELFPDDFDHILSEDGDTHDE